jgi:deoxyadenosine/deoxycytidine kinase
LQRSLFILLYIIAGACYFFPAICWKGKYNLAGQVRIVVDGMTASGKSTLVNVLSAELNLRIMPEMFEDPFELLPRYAYDPKWCLPMQLNFLITRYSQYMVAAEANDYILDRSIFSDKVYADLYYQMGHLDEDQYSSYVNLHNSLIRNTPKPDCMVFLTCAFDEVMRRIYKRGRDFEIHQGEKYWQALYGAYARHIDLLMQANPESNYLLVNSQEVNYVRKPEDKYKLVERIRQVLSTKQAGIA